MRSEAVQEEFLAVYDENADAVFRFCYAKTGNRDEAKDLAQEAFVRVWQYLEKGAEVREMRAFLYTVARNLVKDYYKKKKPVLERDLPEGTLEQVAVGASQSAYAETQVVLDALGRIPDAYREALTLHLVEGIPIGEIAELLGERPNTISVRVKRGLEKIRAELQIDTP